MKSPFKFLDSYTKYDREIFFGRDREIEELYHRVFESKLMLVYGVSGTGKSSLIHCGLANKFSETDWLPLVVRRGGNIINSMAGAIQASAITKQEGQLSSPIQFKKAVRSLYLDHFKPVYFIFDQFEELFIFGDKEERKSFVHIIKSLVESDLQCRLIFVMREEYMAGVTEFERYIPLFFANRVRIEKMSHLNALQAIKEPCKVFNISLEEGFAETLLEKLSPGMAEVELTYLQVFLDKIFRLAKGDKGAEKEQELLSFTLPLLHEVGNVSDLLGSFLDEQIALLSNPDTALAVLKSFVSVRGTKRPMTSGDVKEYAQTLGKPVEESELLEMLQTFIHLRILRDKDQDERYELRHDALAAKIFEKITLVEKELLEIRQLIENAYNSWQKRGVLLSADDLQYIAPYESRLYLPDDYGKFIEKSKKELLKIRHRRRNIFIATAILLIFILGGFTLWALKEKKNAVEKESIANEAKIKATASEKEAIIARDKAIESDMKAVASEKEAIAARDIAKESELRIKQEKELAVIRERQARANNYNYLSKEVVNQDPTIALRLAQYAFSLDSDNKTILSNLNRIYYDNSLYKIFFKDKKGSLIQISPDWTKIISGYGRAAGLTDINGNNLQIFIGHLINGFPLSMNVHQISRAGYDDILSLAFSPDGNLVLTGSSDMSARLWDLHGNILQIFKGHVSLVRSVAFSPDSKTVLTGSSDKTARLWDLKGNCLQVFNGHKFDVLSVAFSPDGQSILTGSSDSTARLWDLKGITLQIFKGHTSYVSKAVFSPDGKTILTGSRDNTARLWDLQGKSLQTFSGHLDYITSIAFSPDGKTFLTGSSDRTARLWDINGNTLQILKGHLELINSVAFSPDGRKIITSSSDGLSRIWDITQNEYKNLTGHKGIIYSASFSPDGKTILTGSWDQTAKFWDLNGNTLQTLRIFSNSVALSPDGKTILTGFLAAQILDLNGNVLKTFTGHTQQILSVAFSPDGKNILTGSIDKTARLWDLDGNTLKKLSGHSQPVVSVTFSPDGKSILTGSQDNTARLWDLNGNLLQIFSGHTNFVISVAFSPDGKTILTGSGDKTARLWDLSGNTLQIFTGHSEAIKAVAFSPDGKSIITGSFDKTARLWDLRGNTFQILSGHKNYICSVAFSPDGKTILTGSADNTARLINVKPTLEHYLKEKPCEELSLEQKLQYGMVQIDQLNKEKDVQRLFEAIKFCLTEAKLNNNKTEYLNQAVILFKKLSACTGNTTNRKSYISNGIGLFRLLPQKYISERIENANQMFVSASTKEEIKEAFDFYSELCSYLDSVKIGMKIPECFIKISDKLLSIDTTARYTISSDLSGISWPLLQNRKFKTSLEAITLAVKADSTNPFVYTTLPLAMVLNNRFDEASKLYLKYYKVFMFTNAYKSYRVTYLEDIADLESRGITHPDFVRVKELLNM
jgi:WD40 repeat protein